MFIFGDAVYNTTKSEMDNCFDRCEKCACRGDYHLCMHYVHLADSDPEEQFAAWCTKGETP